MRSTPTAPSSSTSSRFTNYGLRGVIAAVARSVVLVVAFACGDINPIADPDKGGGNTDDLGGNQGGGDVQTSDVPGVEDVTAVDAVENEDVSSDTADGSGDTTVTPAGPGTPCSASDDCASGYCVDGVCCYTTCDTECVACTTALTGLPDGSCGPVAANTDPKGTCPDDGAPSCGRTGVCDGKGGCTRYGTAAECSPPSCAAGQRTGAGTCDGQGGCAPGDVVSCGDYVCSGNVCAGECASDAGCADGTWCDLTNGTCVPQKSTGQPCQSGKNAQCESGFCVDGVCCDALCDGACSACSAALTGDDDGVCAPSTAGTDPDTECADLGAATCSTDGFCDGVGACRLYGPTTSCGDGSCTEGVGTSPRLCDGAGTCGAAMVADCAPYVCSGAACGVTCASDAGCILGAYCDNGTCISATAQGGACQSDAACGTGYCRDGVCCESTCDSACTACAAAMTGASDGTCAPALTGTDPGDDCQDEGVAGCGNNGTCDGVGACARYASGTVCGPSSCTGGVETNEATCDGAGHCDAGQVLPCAPFDCGQDRCLNGCDVDGDCLSGSYCKSGTCKAKEEKGSPCTAAGQCATGQCVDGVCCDGACDDACVACSAAKKGGGLDGACGPVSAGQDPDADCDESSPASCGIDGTCDGAGACRFHPASTPCSSAVCTGGSLIDSGLCDGEGTCQPGASSPCAPYACGDAVCKSTCATAADCTQGNQCVLGECIGLVPQGGACGEASQCTSGYCVDGVCCATACTGLCQACSAARKGAGSNGTCGPIGNGMDPDSECTDAGVSSCGTDGMCNGAGACRLYATGSTCSNATCGAGIETKAGTCNGTGVCQSGATASCSPYLCGPTSCKTSCAGDGDCAGGHWCNGGTCTERRAAGAACAVSNQCQSGFCVDSVCCNTSCAGGCLACSAAKKGGGADGACGNIASGADPDGECTDQGAASCGTDGQCDGTGACRKFAAGTVCTPAACTSGVQTAAATCNGTGTCIAGSTSACAPYVCGPSACKTTCGVDGECTSGFCSGGQCSGKVGNGGACSASNQCASSQCVDGVCCDTGCTGLCQACTAAKKGGGVDGVCGAIGASLDPDNECATQPASSCGTDGTCNGAGSCRLHASGTTCGAGACSQGSQTAASTCNGTGSCIGGTSTSCAPYGCGGATCKTACTADTDCASGHYCEGGTCTAKKSAGGACLVGSQCTSGFCVDGVCCNTACGGTCQACTAAKKGAGTDGTCGAIGSGGDPDSECSEQSAASCGTTGACDGGGACQRYGANTTCTSASCSGGTQTSAGTCNGSGTCNAGATSSCALYQCGPSACLTSCASDANCVSSAYCAGGSCQPKKGNGNACGSGNQCTSGACVDGVCCETGCAGVCNACVGSKTGLSDGKCGAVTAGTDPDSECTDQGVASCGTNGVCNGAGACQRYPSGTQCAGPSCSSGTQSSSRVCNGLGTCGSATTSACSPYQCGASACATSCAADTNCVAGYYCTVGTCQPRKVDGATCTGANQCGSGQCVDGYCCNSSCAGPCQACNAAKTGAANGVCTSVVGGTDPDNECTDQGVASCGNDGTCSDNGSCRVYGPGTVCAAASCSSGVQTAAGTCDGSGTCNAGGTAVCNPYNCGTNACVTTCTTAADCQSGYYCTNGTCQPIVQQGEACTTSAACATGYCTDGYCCDSACEFTCWSCDGQGSDGAGYCSPISYGYDGNCPGFGQCCNGQCLGWQEQCFIQ
ncbi:MAG: hypothetical protein IV100_33200 [Myxococcales bacterium]|nr:hypothetical protein [Myxococcales bacterium]